MIVALPCMLTLTLKVVAIALVHMPVHHIVGIPGLERRVKAFESSMWQIIQIAHAGGGCMGEQDVAAADHPHFAEQLAASAWPFPCSVYMLAPSR